MEEEDIQKEYIEETNRDAIMIAASNLIASDIVPKVSNFLSFKKFVDFWMCIKQFVGFWLGWNILNVLQ